MYVTYVKGHYFYKELKNRKIRNIKNYNLAKK